MQSAAPLDKSLCARLLASLQPDYEGYQLSIENHYPYAALDEAALLGIFEEMKGEGVPINGFLDRCTLAIEGSRITVGARNGTGFLRDLQFERLLADRIEAHTGSAPRCGWCRPPARPSAVSWKRSWKKKPPRRWYSSRPGAPRLPCRWRAWT